MLSARQEWGRPDRVAGDEREWKERDSASDAGIEGALLRASRAGDPAALEQLLALHKGSIFGLCFDMLGHADDAEDAVQETFLRVLRSLPRFRGEASFRT